MSKSSTSPEFVENEPLTKSARVAAWRKANLEQYKHVSWKNRLRMLHDLTPEEYEEIFIEQGRVCLTCHKPESFKGSDGTTYRLEVDHDHNRGCVHRPTQVSCKNCFRGLLCNNCNSALGFLKDDVDKIQSLIKYLSRPQGAVYSG